MAQDWSAPDVETARILREEGGPYSPPERRLPIKAVLSVGLCVAAAGLAGAAVTVRSAARAPARQEHPWAFVQAWKEYLTEECSDLLDALETEAEETGRTTHEGEEVECKDSEQICTATFTKDGFSEAHPKCFPVICQEARILKGLKEDQPDLLDLTLTCATPDEREEEWWNTWKKYLTEECYDIVHPLEKEAEETGRTTHQGEWVECKDSGKICTWSFTRDNGFSETRSSCFPVVCQEANLFRAFQELNPDLRDFVFTCAKPGGADPKPDEAWKEYLTEECSDLLDALEKEAEETGRTTHEGEEVECKDSEQICTATFTIGGFSEAQSKCFPVVCQEANILKGLKEDMPHLLDLAWTCRSKPQG